MGACLGKEPRAASNKKSEAVGAHRPLREQPGSTIADDTAENAPETMTAAANGSVAAQLLSHMRVSNPADTDAPLLGDDDVPSPFQQGPIEQKAQPLTSPAVQPEDILLQEPSNMNGAATAEPATPPALTRNGSLTKRSGVESSPVSASADTAASAAKRRDKYVAAPTPGFKLARSGSLNKSGHLNTPGSATPPSGSKTPLTGGKTPPLGRDMELMDSPDGRLIRAARPAEPDVAVPAVARKQTAAMSAKQRDKFIPSTGPQAFTPGRLPSLKGKPSDPVRQIQQQQRDQALLQVKNSPLMKAVARQTDAAKTYDNLEGSPTKAARQNGTVGSNAQWRR